MMQLPPRSTLDVHINHPSLDGFSLLHLSDLHINTKTSVESMQALVNQCKNVACECIIITGDIIDTKVKFITQQLHILNQLPNVYYISGNHDIFYGLDALKKALHTFTFLDNALEKIRFKNQDIYLVGLADRFSKFFHVQRDIQKVIQLTKHKEPLIFLAHQPKDYKIALQTKASLFLCGHTHGGQIWPFHYLVRLVQPYLSGLHYKSNMAIYVNSGLGTWGIHYRYKAQSEITLLQLKPSF